MNKFDISVPSLGESISEATIAKWYKKEGETIDKEEIILELETDKVNVEVPAPSNGVLGSIAVKEGETVNVGSLLGTISSKSNQEESTPKEVKIYNPPNEKNNTIPPPARLDLKGGHLVG